MIPTLSGSRFSVEDIWIGIEIEKIYRMSRSKRKIPIRGVTKALSEKRDKRLAHRRWRRSIKLSIKQEEEVFPLLREISDVWDFAKDGKVYDPSLPEKFFKK